MEQFENDLDIHECLGELYTDKEYRRAFYLEYGFNESAFSDPDKEIRRIAFIRAEWPEIAYQDPDSDIRYTAYRMRGEWPASALNDVSATIRAAAYSKLGFDYNDYQALNDPANLIVAKALEARAWDVDRKVYKLQQSDIIPQTIKFAMYVPNYGYLAKKRKWVFVKTLAEAKLQESVDDWYPLMEICEDYDTIFKKSSIYRFEIRPIFINKSIIGVKVRSEIDLTVYDYSKL